MKIIDLEISNAFRKMRVALESDARVAEKLKMSAAHVGRIRSGKIHYFEDETWQRIEPLLRPYMGDLSAMQSGNYNVAGSGNITDNSHVAANGYGSIAVRNANIRASEADIKMALEQQVKNIRKGIHGLDIDDSAKLKVIAFLDDLE